MHYVLTTTTLLLAPWAPFVSDKLYRDLTSGMDMPASVHLTDWPQASKPDKELLQQMAEARYYINEGLRQRAEAGIKVRQPLPSVKLTGTSHLRPDLEIIISEELNVKAVSVIKPTKLTGKETFIEVTKRPTSGIPAIVVLDTTISDELQIEGIMRDLVRQIQNARKQAGLDVSDRIDLVVESDAVDIQKALHAYTGTIKQETLAVTLNKVKANAFSTNVKLSGGQVNIKLARAKG